MRRPPRTWIAAFAGCVALTAAACIADGRSQPGADSTTSTSPANAAVRSLAGPGAPTRQTVSLVAGDGRVLGYTAAYAEATEDVVVKRVDVPLPSHMNLVATRLSYMRRALDGHRLAASIGVACFDTWPPAGYGPSFDAAGARLRKGDTFHVLVYARADRPGPFEIEGVTIEYELNGASLTQQIGGGVTAGVVVGKADELGPGRGCGSIVPTWSTPPRPENACLAQPDTPCGKMPE